MSTWRGRLLRLAITAAVAGWVWRQVAAGDVVTLLASTPWWAFVVPTALMLLNAFIHAIRVRLLLRAAGVEAAVWPLYGALLRASFLGLVLPTGGSEVAKVATVGRLIGRSEAALAALLAARLLELVPWTALLLLGLWAGVAERDPLLGAAAIGFSAAFSAAVAVAVVGVWRGPVVVGRLPGRVGRFARRSAEALVAVGRRPRLVGLALLLAVPFALINNVAIWAALRGSGVEALGLGEVLCLFPVADTLIALPVTISGIGVREGVFVRALAPWGVGEAQAVTAGLVRWVGELGRAAVGGVWLTASRENV